MIHALGNELASVVLMLFFSTMEIAPSAKAHASELVLGHLWCVVGQ